MGVLNVSLLNVVIIQASQNSFLKQLFHVAEESRASSVANALPFVWLLSTDKPQPPRLHPGVCLLYPAIDLLYATAQQPVH